MGKYFRTIYLYIVSFITLTMIVAGVVGTVHNTAGYMYPTMSDYVYEEIDAEKEQDAFEADAVVEAELIAKRTNLKEIFVSIAMFACGAPLYVFHSKQLKKESEKEV